MTRPERRLNVRGRVAALAAAFAAAFVLVNLGDLTSYPLVTDDEVLLNEPARALALNGTFRSPLLSPDHTPRNVLVQPPVQSLAVGAVYGAAGFGLWPTRLASLLWAAALLALVMWTAAGGSPRPASAALVAALLLLLNPSFWLVARMGRMDALCLAFALLAVVACRRGERPESSRAWMAASGALTALACLTHLVAFGFLLGMIVAIATGRGARWMRLRWFVWGGLAVAAAGGALMLCIGQEYVTTLVRHGAIRSANSTPFGRLREEAGRWIVESWRYPGVVACFVAGTACALARPELRRQPRMRALLLIAAAMLAFNAVTMSKASGFYSLYPAVFLTLVAAAAFADAMHESRRARAIAAGLLAAATAASVPTIALPRLVAAAFQRDARDYRAVESDLASLVPAGSRVWTVAEGWYALARDGRSVRTPSLGFNPAPDPAVDDYAVVRPETRVEPGFVEVGRVGGPVPLVWGRRFANTDYRMVVTRSVRHSRGSSGGGPADE